MRIRGAHTDYPCICGDVKLKKTYGKEYELLMLYYKYYLFYRSDGEVMAYTDDSQIADNFSRVRSKQSYYQKKRKLMAEDLKSLHTKYPEALLKWVKLFMGGYYVSLALTVSEELTVTHYVNQAIFVDIPMHISVPSSIFEDDIQVALDVIGYTRIYHYIHNNTKYVELKPNYLSCFLHLYRDTIDWKGDGIYEAISLLHRE